MTEQSNTGGPAASNEGLLTRLIRAAEIDTRMLGMLAAMLVIWVGFDVISSILRPGGGGLFGGSFLTSRNLWILLVQTSVIAVMRRLKFESGEKPSKRSSTSSKGMSACVISTQGRIDHDE